jgi:hypothetical protein
MSKFPPIARLGLCLVSVLLSAPAWGQALPTATQALEITAFGAGTVTFTGLDEGRNAGITAGVDLSFRSHFGLRPALEIRGTQPFDNGQVVGLKSGLIGPRFTREFNRFHVYGDAFFGRGALNYVGGYIEDGYQYDRTTSNVFAGGGGIDYRLTEHFDIKADALYERWKTPVTSSGDIHPIPVSLGVVYHLDFNQYGHHRHKQPPVYYPSPMPPPPDATAPTPPPQN